MPSGKVSPRSYKVFWSHENIVQVCLFMRMRFVSFLLLNCRKGEQPYLSILKILTCKIFMILSQNKGFLLSERCKFVKMGLLLPLYCGCITTCIPPVAKTISKTKHKKHAKNKYIHTYIHTYIHHTYIYTYDTYLHTCMQN